MIASWMLSMKKMARLSAGRFCATPASPRRGGEIEIGQKNLLAPPLRPGLPAIGFGRDRDPVGGHGPAARLQCPRLARPLGPAHRALRADISARRDRRAGEAAGVGERLDRALAHWVAVEAVLFDRLPDDARRIAEQF